MADDFFTFGPTLKAERKVLTHDGRGLKLFRPVDGIMVSINDVGLHLSRDEAMTFATHILRICNNWTHEPDNDYFVQDIGGIGRKP